MCKTFIYICIVVISKWYNVNGQGGATWLEKKCYKWKGVFQIIVSSGKVYELGFIDMVIVTTSIGNVK